MNSEEANRGPELLLRIRRDRAAPSLGHQVESGLRSAIREGRLRSGQRLPPTRTMAADLGVSRRIVVEAYEQLGAEAWLDARVGSGTYVRWALPHLGAALPQSTVRRPAAQPVRERPRFDFFPGHPDLAAFPRAAWARAQRDVLRELPDAELGYGDPRGHRELRMAVAEYLARVRGVVCRPHHVVICQGVVQALAIIVRTTPAVAGAVRIAVEDPYLPEHRDVLEYAGADVVPVPVDELGVHDEAIAGAQAQLALLTPSHQMPTGVVLSAGRRAALARWAADADALILEDDYDAEYRYDRAPVAAFQALAPHRVTYLGSVSKTLAPGLRLAWMVVPDERLHDVIEAKRYLDAGSPVLTQAALARLIISGAYERHVRAVRRRQRLRRDALLAAVGAHLPDARVGGIAAGLHALVHFDRAVQADELLAAAQRHDVGIYPLNLWRADPPPETSAVVLGYGGLHPHAIAAGVQRLAAAWSEVR